MCIFFLALQPSCRYVLVAANNRDEYFDRNTAPAAFWRDQPGILAGRDEESQSHGGTWLGVSRDGKFATLTNIRLPYGQPSTAARSRGHLVSDFLQSVPVQSPESPLTYCQSVLSEADQYSGFNLITARLRPDLEAAYCSNEGAGTVHSLQPGVYGLSNQQLDSPWRKVGRGKERFAGLVSELQEGSLDPKTCEQQLLDLLCDDTCLYPDENIPEKGFPAHILQRLNSVFVSPVEMVPRRNYGTRTNTVVMVSGGGEVTYTERTRVQPVDLAQPQWKTNSFTFNIETQ